MSITETSKNQQSVEPYISERPQCPECGFWWRGEDIFACFLRKKYAGDPYWSKKSDEEIKESAKSYGWTEESPRYFKHIIGIELPYGHPNRYDGVSYWMCPKCKTTWNRFTQEKEEIPQ